MREIKKDACEGFRGGKVSECWCFVDENGAPCAEKISKSLYKHIRDLKAKNDYNEPYIKELETRLKSLLGGNKNERD